MLCSTFSYKVIDMKEIINPSKRQKALLAQAVDLAFTSTHRFKHGAVLVKGGRVISRATNKSRVHDSWVKFQDRENCGVHAEAAALSRVGNSAKGAVMYVARVNPHGNPANSKPCPNCHKALVDAGVSKVVYTT